MNALAARLAERIARHGPISVADYMVEALTHPRHGYYMTGDPFGAAGDFVTAPEISQMFGELLGLWCAETWTRMGAPAEVSLIELGPGRGTLIVDALRAARVLPDFLKALRLHLVEASPGLRQVQQAALAAAPFKGVPVAWHGALAEVPRDRPCLVLANEFFDALPLRQFERTPEGWRERMVGLTEDGGSLVFRLAPFSPAAAPLIPAALREAPAGAVAEVAPAALSIATQIAERLATEGGAALIVDYGYAAAEGRPTLQALQRHQRVGPLDRPGEADLTAHVDFGTLATCAREAGAEAWGPVEQGAFLQALGIAARAERLLAGATEAQAAEIRAALDRLTAPEQMGRLFKALILTPPGFGPLAGCPA